MSVTPSKLSSAARDRLTALYGVVWNTEDSFDSSEADYREIMEFHRALGFPHWYLPHHSQLSKMVFASEEHAFEMARIIRLYSK